MKIKVLNQTQGMIPLFEEDYEEKKKLQLNKIYEVEINEVRNIKFHRLFFAFLNKVWAFQSEKITNHYVTLDNFRKTILLAAGHCDTVYNVRLGTFVETPRSLAFTNMNEEEFRDLFTRVKKVCFEIFLPTITTEQYNEHFAIFD